MTHVINLFEWQSLIGVFDLDALELNSFDDEDKEGLENIVKVLVSACDWP